MSQTRSSSQARQSGPPTELVKKQDPNVSSRHGHGGGRRKDPHQQQSSRNSWYHGRGGGGGGRGSYKKNLSHQRQQQDYRPVKEEDEFELGSLYNIGSKKQNLNHLLNFQFAPRGGNRGGGGHVRNRNGGRGARDKGGAVNYYRPPPTYTKSHYLQANCQFIVQGAGDYSLHLEDPDTLVDWEKIEQVHLKTSGSNSTTNCPICLSPPVAGKISRCGHVFCWPCILHYLALSDDESRKCPICDQQISRPDLRSVVVIPQKENPTGVPIEMRLMKRERNSLFSVPVQDNTFQDIPYVDQEGLNRSFVKILKASSDQVMMNIIARERRELETQFEEEKDQPESCFILEALQRLVKREEQVIELGHIETKQNKMEDIKNVDSEAIEEVTIKVKNLKSCYKNDEEIVDPFASENLDDLIQIGDDVDVKQSVCITTPRGRPRSRYASGHSETSSEGEEAVEENMEVTAEDLDISSIQQENIEIKSCSTSSNEPKQTFYFYQASDGQQIFLHALNVQMLVAEFGSFECCPSTLSATILEKDSTTMTSDLRNRLRYLRHLPVSSVFEVAELDITDLVGKETLAKFRDQLETRRRKRKRKQKDEQRRERKIYNEEQRMMGFPGSMVRVESEMTISRISEEKVVAEFPTMDGATEMEQSGGCELSFANIAKNRKSVEEFPSMGTEMDQSGGCDLSFANIAKTKKSVAPVEIVKKPSTGWASLGTVINRPTIVRPMTASDSEPEPEGYIPPPLPVSLGDTLAAALQKVDTTPSGGGGGKKKGRKGKQIVLSGGPPRPVL